MEKKSLWNTNKAAERIGQIVTQNCGRDAEIIAYKDAMHITVQFVGTTTTKDCCYSNFVKGKILFPGDKKPRPKGLTLKSKQYIGRSKRQNCGYVATIIRSRGYADNDVKFDDPNYTIREHISIQKFEAGQVNILSQEKRKQKHVGETNIMRCGLTCTIIAVRSHLDITVKFDDRDGTEVSGKSYNAFKSGSIFPPYVKNSKFYKNSHNRLGEKKVQKNGLSCEIISYDQGGKIKALYEIGGTVDGIYSQFKSGELPLPTKIHGISKMEFFLQKSLEDNGFLKVESQSALAKELKLDRFEIDMTNYRSANSSNRIAIEFDGICHKNRLEKDNMKNDILADRGFDVIRIRDAQLKDLDVGLRNCMVIYFSREKDYRSVLNSILKKLSRHLHKNYGIKIATSISRSEYENINIMWGEKYKNAKQIPESVPQKDGHIAEFIRLSEKSGCCDVYFPETGIYKTDQQIYRYVRGQLSAKARRKNEIYLAKPACDHNGEHWDRLDEMLAHYGITPAMYRSRLRSGWDLRDILLTPENASYLPHDVPRILCVETNETYRTQTEAQKAIGHPKSTMIGNALNGKYETAYGRHWERIYC